MVTTQVFKPNTADESHRLLASHLPQGKLWEAAFDVDSNMGKLVRGLSAEFIRLQILCQTLAVEMNIDTADQLITEWEQSVGIPNDCFSTNGTLEERRLQVKGLFSNFAGVQTAGDFVRVAALFGITVTIEAGSLFGGFPLVFPTMFFDSSRSMGHTIVVNIAEVASSIGFPMPFPIPFSSGSQQLLTCLYEALAPANVNIIFV